MVPQREVGDTALRLYLVLPDGQNPRRVDSLQQDERAAGPQVDVNGVVVEASVELVEVRGLVYEHRWCAGPMGRSGGAVGDAPPAVISAAKIGHTMPYPSVRPLCSSRVRPVFSSIWHGGPAHMDAARGVADMPSCANVSTGSPG